MFYNDAPRNDTNLSPDEIWRHEKVMADDMAERRGETFFTQGTRVSKRATKPDAYTRIKP